MNTISNFKLNKMGIIVALVALFLLSGCANNEVYSQCLTGSTYGFWGGLWHGIIAPFDLIGMLIWDDVAMYAPNNNGAWYAFGFIIGSGGWGLLASRSKKKSCK